jgi:GNAT superfamily N-acetyltransferase
LNLSDVEILICEDFEDISDELLKQTAVLRWGYNESNLASQVNRMRSDPFGYISFYVFALVNGEVWGFAYFCKDETDSSRWYYGDLIVHKDGRREGIATKMITQAIRALKGKNAVKLFTYIDIGNEVSFSFHRKLDFSVSDNQKPINRLLADGKIVYARAL